MRSFRVDLLVVAVGLMVEAVARAQCESDWQPVGPVDGVNERVYCSTVWDPDGPGPEPTMLVVGGLFTTAGDELAHGVAAWDGTRWRSIGRPGPLSPPHITSLVVWDGALVAGYGYGCAIWDGATWRQLGTIRGDVLALAVFNGELIATDNYRTPMRWIGGSWQSLGGPPNDFVRALHVHNGELIAIGDFTSIGGASASKIAAWNGQTWRPLGAGLGPLGGSSLTSIGTDLYAGGYFTTAGGAPASRVAKWNGTLWSAVGSGLNEWVRSLNVYNGRLYAGGDFTMSGSTPVGGVVMWDGAAWQACGLPTRASTYTLMPYRGELIAGGLFASQGGIAAPSIARWNGTSWNHAGASLSGEVSEFAVYRDRLFVASGPFGIGGVMGRPLASFDGSRWYAQDGLPSGSFTITDMHVFNDELLIGQSLTNVRLNRWNGTSMSPFPIQPPGVYSMTTWNGQLVVCYGAVMLWTGSGWSVLSGGLPDGALVVAVVNGELYAAGPFGSPAPNPPSRVARWNGSAWVLVGAGLHDTGTIDVMASFGNRLVVGGVFSLNRQPALIAQWDGTAWSTVGEGLRGPIYQRVFALHVHNGSLIASGNFDRSGSLPLLNVARWDGTQWHAIGQGIGPASDYPAVNAIASYRGRLFVGGRFDGSGGRAMPNLASFGCTCPADLDDGSLMGVPDGGVTIDDLLFYLGVYAMGDGRADLDNGTFTGTPDGGVTIDDLLYFLLRFEVGC